MMGAIYTLLTVLGTITFLVMIVGLIRPPLVVRWGEKRTRGRVLLYYGIGAMVLGSLASAVMPDEVREKQEQARLEREREKEEARLKPARENLEKGTRLFSIARAAYESQDYQTAIDSAGEATRALEKAKSDINEAAVLASQAQTFLDSAKAAAKKAQEQKKLEQKRKEAVAKKAQEQKKLEQKRKEAVAKKAREEARYTTKPGTLERTVEKHVIHVFGHTVSREEGKVPRVKSISVGYSVNVAYRESDPLFGDMRKNILSDAHQFMERVFTDPACSKVQVVLLRPHFPLVDKYGNTSEGQIGKLQLNREVAEKINWGGLADFTLDMFERLLRTEGQLWWHNALKK